MQYFKKQLSTNTDKGHINKIIVLFENILVKKCKSKGSTNLDIQNGVLLNSISLLRQ